MPLNPEAARIISSWLQDRSQALNAVNADLRGADLSDGVLWESWLSYADLSDVQLRNVDLYRAHLEEARCTGADLSGAGLVRAVFDGANLVGAVFNTANLTSASLNGVDARQASFRACDFTGASLLSADVRGADFSESTMKRTSFKVRLDESTNVTGMRGEILGPCLLMTATDDRELGAEELHDWLNSRGANVEVMVAQRPRSRGLEPS